MPAHDGTDRRFCSRSTEETFPPRLARGGVAPSPSRRGDSLIVFGGHLSRPTPEDRSPLRSLDLARPFDQGQMMQRQRKVLRSIIVSAVMTALAVILPMAFHAVGLASKFLPMFLPLLLNGVLSAWPWAIAGAPKGRNKRAEGINGARTPYLLIRNRPVIGYER